MACALRSDSRHSATHSVRFIEYNRFDRNEQTVVVAELHIEVHAACSFLDFSLLAYPCRRLLCSTFFHTVYSTGLRVRAGMGTDPGAKNTHTLLELETLNNCHLAPLRGIRSPVDLPGAM